MRRKSIFVLILCAMALSVMAQNSTPQWVQELQRLNADIIDSIVAGEPDEDAPQYDSYLIYYHQPLSHANPQGAQFPMRTLLTVDNRKDPTTAVNHVFFSGYNIDRDYIDDPTALLRAGGCSSEIALRYQANYIQPEHRYFDYSAPDECWTNLDYCTAAEATEDFHALFEALKKVFKGKWAISGVSKGGITTAIQHAYHPEDADIFLPYSAPFFDTHRDTVMQQYWYNNGWSKEFRDMFMVVRRTAIQDRDKIYPIYEKMNAGNDNSEAHLDSIFGLYLSSIAGFGFDEHAYGDTTKIRQQITDNDDILRTNNLSYCDTVYAFMIEKETFSLKKFQSWLDTLRKYPNSAQGPARVERRHLHLPFGITEQEWKSGTEAVPITAYTYQAKCELGYYDFRFDEIVGKERAAEWNAYLKRYGCYLDLSIPYFASLTFNRSLYDRVTAATQNATKPLVFIYGEDDTWTGAAMKDQFINSQNVRKFILPAQNHMVSFSSNTDRALCDAIRAILDNVLGAPAGIESPSLQGRPGEAHKILQNGQIIIIRNNERYDITGKKL